MKKLISLIILAILITSCVKMPKSKIDNPDDDTTLEIPSGFDWKTIKELDITVGVTAIDDESANKVHIIKIYNSPLANSGSLIASGAATPDSPYKVTISVATPTDKIYIHETTPQGKGSITVKELTSSDVNISLETIPDSNFMTKSNSFGAFNAMFPAPEIDIPAQYDVLINNNNSLTLSGFNTGESSLYGNQFKSYYIPEGFTRTASISFGNWLSHAILYVKGTLVLNSDVSMDKSSIVILDGGSVTFRQLANGIHSENIPIIYIQQGGSLNISRGVNFGNQAIIVNKGSFTTQNTIDLNLGSKVYNEGVITVTKKNNKFSITNNAEFYNSGTINAPQFDLTVNSSGVNDIPGIITTGTWYQSNGTVFNNHGEVAATVKFSNSGGGTVYNHCRITALETNVQALTAYLESGSLWQTQSFFINGSTFNMAGGSMFITANINSVWSMNFVSTSDSWALLKISGNVPDLRWASSQISGKIEVVHENLTEGVVANGRTLYESSLSNGAILTNEQTMNIQGTTCNLSLGQIEPSDPGTPPEFATYFPSQSGWATYAFEDLWPEKGDYDLNDLVLSFRITQITNSSNQIIDLHFDYKVLAVGATKVISAAFQLDNVSANDIESISGQLLGSGFPFIVSGNGTESGVTKAVIPLFNDTKTVVSYPKFLNTVPGEYIASEEKRVSVKFSSPIIQSNITLNSFNFFIVADQRGKEIHLPGYLPTAKFTEMYTSGASLDENDIYKYSDGMMWGLMFPESFSYPSEQNSIIDAYLHFTAWATSGGVQYPDWYMNIEGYRDETLLY